MANCPEVNKTKITNKIIFLEIRGRDDCPKK